MSKDYYKIFYDGSPWRFEPVSNASSTPIENIHEESKGVFNQLLEANNSLTERVKDLENKVADLTMEISRLENKIVNLQGF